MRPYGKPRQLEKRRQRAIQLLKEGKNAPQVARILGCSDVSVYRWEKAYQKKGLEGLKPKPTPGRPCKLSSKQKEHLAKLLLKGTMALGYSTELWTSRRIKEVIQEQFGVDYHPNHIWWFLTRLGWSYQKPELQAKERDEKEVAHWKTYHWPHIKKSQKHRCLSGFP